MELKKKKEMELPASFPSVNENVRVQQLELGAYSLSMSMALRSTVSKRARSILMSCLPR